MGSDPRQDLSNTPSGSPKLGAGLCPFGFSSAACFGALDLLHFDGSIHFFEGLK